MRWLALICCLSLLSTLLGARQALTFPPPDVVPPDEATAKRIERDTEALDDALAAAAKLGVRDPNYGDAEVFLRAAKLIARHNEYYKNGAKQTAAVLDHGLLRAAQLRRGEAPWFTAPQGMTVARAYRSRLDGSLQPYSVTYPADYAQAKKVFRLDVVLHGRNAGLTEVGFLAGTLGKDAPKGHSFVQLDVYGRGNNAYRWAGENDVFEAVENFLAAEALAGRSAALDTSKLVLRGFSMGGAGTWHIGLHRPDQFCLISPGAGFTTTHGYAKLPAKLPAQQEACLRIYDAVEYAENAANVPVIAYSGEDDPQKKAADDVEERLKSLKIEMTHFVAPKTGHSVTPEYRKKLLAAYADVAKKERDAYPNAVRFVTYTLKYPSCHWVELLGLEKHYDQARVEATKTDAGFAVKTKNVRQLRLALWPGAVRRGLTVAIDGQTLEGVRPAQARSSELSVYLEKRAGKWAAVMPERLFVDRLRTAQKSQGLQGPIDDAFTAPFLCVKPSGTAWHERTDEYVKADFERFAREWAKFFRGTLPVKEDHEVTAEDVAGKNLILFGDPGSNSLIAEVLPRLPLVWDKKRLALAGKGQPELDAATHVPALIYPSPLAADRYVVLNSGHTFHAAEFEGTNALLFPRLGDHALLKLSPQKDKNGPLSCEVQSAGLFDEFWRVVGGE